jgi:hypothetical protein
MCPSRSSVSSAAGARRKPVRYRASLCASAALAERSSAGDGSATASGSSGQSATAVATETTAVTIFTVAAKP